MFSLGERPAGAPSFVPFEGWETSAGPPYSTTFPRFAISETRDPAPPNPSAPTVIDVGSGPGFPGIPLKIFDPTIRVTLLESTQKKVAFLREGLAVFQIQLAKKLDTVPLTRDYITRTEAYLRGRDSAAANLRLVAE